MSSFFVLGRIEFAVVDSNPDKWLTLKAAATLLNVHPKTLRRWADEGNIPCMLTPGGHRRFATSDVSDFMGVRKSVDRKEKIAGAWARQAMVAVRGRVGDAEPLMGHLSDEARQEYRTLGRSLLGLAVKYAAAEQDVETMAAEARSMGRQYARLSQKTGLSVSAALKMSMFFRETVVGSALSMSDDFHVRAHSESELIRRINQLINNVQMAVVEVYDANNTDSLPRT
jgi:excisionase family DNA binding protein